MAGRSRVITLSELKKSTGVTEQQLDTLCTEEHLSEISQHFIEYQKFGPRLGLSGKDIQEIQRNPDYFHSLRLKAEGVLKSWRSKNTETATFRVLVDVALKLEDGQSAKEICLICATVKLNEKREAANDHAQKQEKRSVLSDSKGTITNQWTEVDQKLMKMANRLEVTDNQLDTECIDDHLEHFGKTLVGFEKYAYALHLSSADIDAIDNDTKGTKLNLTKALKKWKGICKNNSTLATYRSLLRVAIKIEDGYGAEEICNTCKQIVMTDEVDAPDFTSKDRAEKPQERERSVTLSAQTKKALSTGKEDSVTDEIKQNIERGNQTMKKTPKYYCTMKEEDVVYQAESGTNQIDAASGWVCRHLRWDMTRHSKLRIHFLNPDVLEEPGWKCGDDPLSITTILAWAATWNTHAKHYPTLDEDPADKMKAHIRVKFDSSKSTSSWSKIGKAALRVSNKDEPTMVLNLHELTVPEQKSMVLHEFGHALGLEHEHQRSDFWDVLETRDHYGDLKFIIGRRRMEAGDNRNCLKACDAVFKSNIDIAANDVTRTEYDPESIMHYWFDVNWLCESYRKLGDVETDEKLTPKERAVLKGVHTRDYRTGGRQASKPSQSDYDTLNKAYESQHPRSDNITQRSDTDQHASPFIPSEKSYSSGDSSNLRHRHQDQHPKLPSTADADQSPPKNQKLTCTNVFMLFVGIILVLALFSIIIF